MSTISISGPVTNLVKRIVMSDGRIFLYEYDKEERITKVTESDKSAPDTVVSETVYTYDSQGNPVSYLGHTLTWEKGRQLKKFDSNTYTYNAGGIRIGKTVSGVKHSYRLDGSKILSEKWGSNTLIPLYDNKDEVCGGLILSGTGVTIMMMRLGCIICSQDIMTRLLEGLLMRMMQAM